MGVRPARSGRTGVHVQRTSSFIRTIPSAMASDHVCQLASCKPARGLDPCGSYRRWGIAPRPEDVLRPPPLAGGGDCSRGDNFWCIVMPCPKPAHYVTIHEIALPAPAGARHPVQLHLAGAGRGTAGARATVAAVATV